MSHTVVIPCAGKGTRLYPMTKNTSKSMLDLGNFKIIDYAISESLMSGATKIILIISPGDLKLKKHINNIYNSNNNSVFVLAFNSKSNDRIHKIFISITIVLCKLLFSKFRFL